MKEQPFTQTINRLQKRHPGTRRQRSYHGAGHYSVQFFSKETGKLMADYDLKIDAHTWEELGRQIDKDYFL